MTLLHDENVSRETPAAAAEACTPFDLVWSHYKFPEKIEPRPKQIETVNDLAPLDQQGHFLDMGTGKTFTFTVNALYRILTEGRKVVVIMPPLLLPQWAEWLNSITPKLSVVVYAGKPAKRAKINLDADIVLVGRQIFHRDYNKFVAFFQGRDIFVGVDEAHQIAGVESKIHELVYDFCLGQPRAMLTGTPMNRPTDAYGLLKFTAPGVYRNLKHFQNMHVEEMDLFGLPSKYCNLELLAENIKVNSKRVLYSDMYSDVEEPLYAPILYDLEDEHYALYEQLANDQLLALPDGGKIEATTANRLTHALGQIIVNWGLFAGDPTKVSNTMLLLDQKLEELNGKKLVIFAHYKMSVALLKDHFGASCSGAINGDASPTQKERAINDFIQMDKKRTIVIQARSGGFGLDGLQHVSHHCAFVEPVTAPRDFSQAVARLLRKGQKDKVMVMMMQARGTLQRRRFRDLLNNDTLVNSVIRNRADLKDLIFGKDAK